MNFDESGIAFVILDITHWFLAYPPNFWWRKFSELFFCPNSDFPLSYIHSWYKKTQNSQKKCEKTCLIKKLISYSDSTPNFTLKSNFWWPPHGGVPLYGRGWGEKLGSGGSAPHPDFDLHPPVGGVPPERGVIKKSILG